MRCLRPWVRRYLDVAGVEHTCECPCGKCIACLHNFQDSWSIRMRETCEAYSTFVYDTLTFSPTGISYRNVTDKVLSNLSAYDSIPEVSTLLKRYSCVDKETGEVMCLVPVIDRSVIRDWIRQGRELFYHYHHYRLKLKYFIVEEYGPKTSRPHFHLLMWGVSREDYITFFAKPWRRKFGFTKTKVIIGGTDKDRDCISRYVSKYVSKGVFESPLVRYGLAPKCFRSISHGIGEEYLQKGVFSFFKGFLANVLSGITVDRNFRPGDWGYNSRIVNFLEREGCPFQRLFKEFDKISGYLTTYYDRCGYVHALPRYYKYKLSNMLNPNILSYALQTYLLEGAVLHHNKKLQRFAYSLGYKVNWGEAKSPHAGFTPELFDLLSRKFAIAERLQSKIEAKGRFIKLKNHYGRAMNLNYAYAN